MLCLFHLINVFFQTKTLLIHQNIIFIISFGISTYFYNFLIQSFGDSKYVHPWVCILYKYINIFTLISNKFKIKNNCLVNNFDVIRKSHEYTIKFNWLGTVDFVVLSHSALNLYSYLLN